jgi:hypothetical protein
MESNMILEKRLLKEESVGLPEEILYLLNKYNFSPSQQYKGTGQQSAPFSPKGSICYAGNDCKMSDEDDTWKAYTKVHLEFDITSSPMPYVYVIVEFKDKNKVTKTTTSEKLGLFLSQEGADDILTYLYDQSNLNNVAFGC